MLNSSFSTAKLSLAKQGGRYQHHSEKAERGGASLGVIASSAEALRKEALLNVATAK